jgi:20S proteasome alpha/beta subunit
VADHTRTDRGLRGTAFIEKGAFPRVADSTQYLATAIGSGKKDVEKFFEKAYKPSMTKADAIKLAIDALKQVSATKFSVKNVNVAVVDESDRRFKVLPQSEIEAALKKKA